MSPTTDSRPNLSSGLTLRQWYILAYAEYLHTDPGLWRLTVDYLCSCGDVGKEMADEVLVRVPLQLQQQQQAAEVRMLHVVQVLPAPRGLLVKDLPTNQAAAGLTSRGCYAPGGSSSSCCR